MNRVWLPGIVLLLAAACGGGDGNGGAEEVPEDVVVYFENGNVIIGDGSPMIEDAAIVVDNGVITAIGPRSEIAHPPGADRYDMSEHTAIPFLINVHGHVGYRRNNDFGSHNYTPENAQVDLNRYLYYGVGAVAVRGTDLGDTAMQIRDAQAGSETPHTRIYTSGRGITAARGFPSDRDELSDVPIQVSNETEARQAVADLAAMNVDFVKIWVDDNRQISGQVFRGGERVNNFSSVPKLSAALYAAIIDEAHQSGLTVAAHVRSLADAKALVAAGVDGIIHSIRDQAVDPELIDAMLENDVFFTPTLARHQIEFVYCDQPDWLRESFLRESVSGAVISRLTNSAVVRGYCENLNEPTRRQEFARAMENFKTLYDAGVRVGLGTDSGAAETFPGYFEHLEMELMVEAGLTPMEAIHVGAARSAEILGMDDLGALAVGLPGNFIIVPEDPTADISASRNIAEVFFRGERVERSSMMVDFSN